MVSTMKTQERIELRKLFWVGPLAIVSALVANLLLRAIAVTLLGVPESFQYLQIPSIIGSTVIFLLLAMLAFVLVSRLTRRPIFMYRLAALIALCLSFISPLLVLTGVMPAVGMSMTIFWTMILMHIVSAVIAVSLLTTLTRSNR